MFPVPILWEHANDAIIISGPVQCALMFDFPLYGKQAMHQNDAHADNMGTGFNNAIFIIFTIILIIWNHDA